MKNNKALGFPFLPELHDRAQLTQISLELPESLSFEEWEKIGRGFGKLDQATQWWVGDWWAFGGSEDGGKWSYGKRKAIVESEDWTGPAYQTCNIAAITCRTFKTIRRRINLSFTHHATLASLKLNPELVESLLDWCEAPLKNGAKKVKSVRQLEDEIIIRHNNHLFDSACRSLDDLLLTIEGCDPNKRKELKGAICLALVALVKQRNQEKISLTENELRELILTTIEAQIGSIRGNVKMLTEFIGPVRRLAERTDFDFDEMIKAEPSQLIDRDISYCEKAKSMIETFIQKLTTKVKK